MRFLGFNITRDSIKFPKWYEQFFFTGKTSAVNVNESTIRAIAAFWAAVKLKSNSLSTPRINIQEELPDGTIKILKDHGVYKLLNVKPNSFMTPFSFRQALEYNKEFFGNGYAAIGRATNGTPTELIPIRGGDVEVKRVIDGDRSEIFYVVDTGEGDKVPIASNDMFHWLGMTNNGYVGINVIQALDQVFGIAISGDDTQANTFKNGSRLDGILSTEGRLKPDDLDRLEASWNKGHNGANAESSTAVLDNGMKFQPIAMSPGDIQLLETRQYSEKQMAQIVGVPPHMIGILDRATDNNIEKQGIEFVRYGLNPDATQFEQEVCLKLLTEAEQGRVWADFDFTDLERGDTEAVMNKITKEFDRGTITVDEFRKVMKRNPLGKDKGGDDRFMPLNMGEVEQTKKNVDSKTNKNNSQANGNTGQNTGDSD